MSQTSWIQRYRQLRLVVKRAVATLQAGAHRSIFKGSGLAFEEVRQYQPGDEVRSIDWNVTARMGQPYVKRFVEERELRILFVLDVSASQQTGSGLYLKRDIAAEIIALLTLSGLRFNDSLGIALASDQIEYYLPPGRGMRHALKLIHLALYREPEQHKTDLGKAIGFAAKVMLRRSVVVLISDFLDSGWQPSLERLAHRHDVIAIRTQDPLDNHAPSSGLLFVEDAETGQVRLIDSRRSPADVPAMRPRTGAFRWIDVTTDGRHLETLMQALNISRSEPARSR